MRNEKMKNEWIPKNYQAPYPNRILKGRPEGESLEFDFLFIGAGPASLSGAIHLARLFNRHFKNKKPRIGILEKASRLGGHSLSGAIINPLVFEMLFPEEKESWPFRLPVKKERLYFLTKKRACRLPLPPSMKNKGFYTASLSEVVRWLGKKAEGLGVDIFTNTSAGKLIVKEDRVIGVQTTAMGLSKNFEKKSSYQEPISIFADTIFLADGVRGNLSQSCLRWKNISSYYPEHYALGVKEIWKVKKAPDETHHTVGHPLKGFGGSFLYPLSKEHIALGLVSGLDSQDSDTASKFQEMKKHPFFEKILKDGECLEWGAKAIPEGGYHAIPDKISGPGFFIIGDAAQLVDVPSLKGIHFAMLSGVLSAEYAFKNQQGQKQESFESILKNHALLGQKLYASRNIVQTLQKSPFSISFLKAGLMMLSKGLVPGDLDPKTLKSDSETSRPTKLLESEIIGSTKQDQVYLSGNKTRDDIPLHLSVPEDLPPYVQNFYSKMCPAGVYEKKNEKFIVNHPNCVDCKATDVLGPWWNPKEGGPDYTLM